MASVTLLEAAKLTQDDLVIGVIENVITTDAFFEVLPFQGIEGNALAYNREHTLGDVINAGVGTTFSGAGAGKAAAAFTQVTSTLTTIMGDAEVNGLIQATRSDMQDQRAIQVASKAKSVGRNYQNMLINGTGASNQFHGLKLLVAASQSIVQDTAGDESDGGPISFAKLDELLDLVKDKDGVVDYITMTARTVRSFKALLRGLGGATINDVLELPSGKKVPVYEGVPVFKNDWIPVDETTGDLSTGTSVYAGTLDDGSQTHGIAGLTAARMAGISVKMVGEKEDADETITRVIFYCGLANFSEKGLARLSGVSN